MSVSLSDVCGVLDALAHPIRLAIVDRLRREDALSIGDLAAEFPVTPAAVSGHVKILRKAGIITYEVHGQKRIVGLQKGSLAVVREWAGAGDQ
jgi:DNA-binding transcriptional ArsR family regulator